MMNRNQLLLVGLAIVLALAAYLVLQRPGEIGASAKSGGMLVQYDSSAVDKLEITSTLGHVVIEKLAGKWTVVKPVNYPANQEVVAEAIGKGRKIELAGLISSNPEKQEMFQVDSTGTLVRVFEKDNLRASFIVGKPSNTFRENYVRNESDVSVYLATELLSPTFARRLDEWRDKRILMLDKEGITSVLFRYGDTTFTLTLTDSVWRIGKDDAVATTVTSFLSSLTSLETDDFIDTTIATPPRLTALIEVQGLQIRFHFNKDTEKYMVQTSASPQWFDVQRWRADQVLKRRKDFLGTAS